tara:strand:+ start:19 stop:210 length:192 start_codon:yes stop_codon:yes gene_type:complete
MTVRIHRNTHSEARHFEDYLTLASQISKTDISERINHFGSVEKSLIESDDNELRFHSGAPDFT